MRVSNHGADTPLHMNSRLAAALLAALALSRAALGSTNYSAPAAEFTVSAEGGTPISTPGTVNGTACNTGSEGGCENSTTSISYSDGGGSGYLNGSTSGGVAVANASGTGEATIFFELLGPSGVTVPLIMTASGSTAANGVEALSQIQVFWGGGSFLACSGTGASAASCNGEQSSFSGTQSYSLQAGVLSDYEVIESGSSTEGTGSYSGSVDLSIEIDPSFSDAGEFTLVFSPNVGVPEPSALTLGSIGLLLLGAIRWDARRRTPGQKRSLTPN